METDYTEDTKGVEDDKEIIVVVIDEGHSQSSFSIFGHFLLVSILCREIERDTL